jgi:hypothetical protein
MQIAHAFPRFRGVGPLCMQNSARISGMVIDVTHTSSCFRCLSAAHKWHQASLCHPAAPDEEQDGEANAFDRPSRSGHRENLNHMSSAHFSAIDASSRAFSPSAASHLDHTPPLYHNGQLDFHVCDTRAPYIAQMVSSVVCIAPRASSVHTTSSSTPPHTHTHAHTPTPCSAALRPSSSLAGSLRSFASPSSGAQRRMPPVSVPLNAQRRPSS